MRCDLFKDDPVKNSSSNGSLGKHRDIVKRGHPAQNIHAKQTVLHYVEIGLIYALMLEGEGYGQYCSTASCRAYQKTMYPILYYLQFGKLLNAYGGD
jgi:hypothetical protein